ncbi:uncharacterized protein LOC130667365 [Microplitis mediator]|uniref:uncharacterized protein LOC130667365 n=1 Tax=Microplitis mediator TaxID=375433 RepID=UPI002552788D|nr:uncharacterized protein LOC130667365 [Microplitis mediator]
MTKYFLPSYDKLLEDINDPVIVGDNNKTIQRLYVADGPCPKVIIEEPLDLARTSGLWFKDGSSGGASDDLQKCVTQVWFSPNDKGVSEVVSTSIFTTTNDELKTVADVIVSNNNAFLFDVHVPITGHSYRESWNLAMDYDNYAITWTCSYNGTMRTENAAIYTRERNPTMNLLRIAQEAFDRYGLILPDMIRIDNQNCP